MDMTTRGCWPALLLKANQALQRAAEDVAGAKQQLAALAQQRRRVNAMMEEYAQRHRALTVGDHYVSESLAIQRFLGQLRLMLDRIEAEALKAEGWHRAALQSLGAAQAEANKFGKRIDLETAARRDSEARSEAKAFDEMALLRFRFRGH